MEMSFDCLLGSSHGKIVAASPRRCVCSSNILSNVWYQSKDAYNQKNNENN